MRVFHNKRIMKTDIGARINKNRMVLIVIIFFVDNKANFRFRIFESGGFVWLLLHLLLILIFLII